MPIDPIWIRFIALVYATTVSSGDDEYVSLAKLGYEGKGARSKSAVGNYKYQFSKYLNYDMCKDHDDTDCWAPQGISKWGNYITRSMYAKSASGRTETHFAIVVMKRGSTPKYSAILIQSGYCHNGDNALDYIDGVYYFILACEDKVVIFSENDIIRLPDDARIRKNGYTFRYYVKTEDYIESESSGVDFDFISRYHGVDNQYISGNYNKDSGYNLNLKAIKLDPDNEWAMSVVTSYAFRDAVAALAGIRVQGATKIGSKMYLVTSLQVYFCDISDTRGAFSGISYISTESSEKILSGCSPKCSCLSCAFTCPIMALEGAETDINGDLFLASEWTDECDFPFWEITNVANDYGDCYDEVPPFNTHNEWEIDGNLFVVGLLCVVTVVIVVSVMTWMTYCSWKKEENYVHKYPSSV
eukprot:277153_1